MEKMSEHEAFILNFLREQYGERNKFNNLLGIYIEKAYNGCAVQSMPVATDKHTNLYNKLHGGALMAIADSCMGVACMSLGKRVVSLDTTIKFIGSVLAPSRVTAEANVIHSGRRTMAVSAKVFDAEGKIIGMASATYYVIGRFDEIPPY